MRLSSLKPNAVEALLESPEDILITAFQVFFLIHLEKHPSSTMEELVVLVGESLLSPRARRWILRLGSCVSQEEVDEIKKSLEVLRNQNEEIAPYWGTGRRLPDRFQIHAEEFAIRLRMATCPWHVRMRAKLLKQRESKRDRDAIVGRQRNNQKAASLQVERFRADVDWCLEHDRTPQQAYTEAMSYAIRRIFTSSKAKNKQAVLSLFKEILSARSYS